MYRKLFETVLNHNLSKQCGWSYNTDENFTIASYGRSAKEDNAFPINLTRGDITNQFYFKRNDLLTESELQEFAYRCILNDIIAYAISGNNVFDYKIGSCSVFTPTKGELENRESNWMI